MEMVSKPITVPKEMALYLNDSEYDRSFQRNAMFLYPYIQDLTISHGRSAEIPGINKLDLINYYASLGLPYLNQSVSELEEDLVTLRKFRREML